MPDLRYPGSTGPFPALTPEPKAEPVTIIALCDGSVTRVKPGDWRAVMHANASAADRLVERIAKRVVEMEAEQALSGDGSKISMADTRRRLWEDSVRLKFMDEMEAKINSAVTLGVQRAKAEMMCDLPRLINSAKARFGAVETVGTAHFANRDALEAGKPFSISMDAGPASTTPPLVASAVANGVFPEAKGADEYKSAIHAAVQSALAEYDEHLNRTLSRRIAQAKARG